ncbi:hypothetical protein [Corynebacterium glyciniphilum]|uniref:pPIWI-associating nuclease domain-containing protein n=1 Tax=Corynebacterium glyciniphilum TaxID=1404244 RepID=UPI0021B24EDF|nr:hypothetical protein [Corynebacterium glyciniphilum]
MARKTNRAQLKAAMNKAQRQQKQAIDNYNRQVRRRNTAVKKAVNDHNREVRAYKAKVRKHNNQVKNQRRRLEQEIRRMNSRPQTRTFISYRASVETLARTYTETEAILTDRMLTPAGRELVNRGSEEAANSAYLLNAMDGDGEPEDDPTEEELRGPSMQAELETFGQDLVDRWTGALFSLSPQNPDAARHFCTSAREVLITMIDDSAPDEHVVKAVPSCDTTDRGVPTRRAKVRFLLQRKGIADDSIEELVEEDMNNVLGLFREFNNGTHGHAGRFTITQLNALRMRVESAIGFIHTLCTR